jgi:hypothetical protein
MAPQTCVETEDPDFERLGTVTGMDETEPKLLAM